MKIPSFKSETVIVALTVVSALSGASVAAQTLNLTGGTIEASLTNQSLLNSATGANDGTVSTWVVSDEAVDSSGYIFIYQLENAGPDEVTGANFNNFTTSAILGTGSYSNVYFGSGFLPGSLYPTVTLSPTFTFDTVTPRGAATFNGGLNIGTVSWFAVIDTDVSTFGTGYGLAQDDFQAHGNILAQNSAVYGVPEPSSVGLLILGLACAGGLWRRGLARSS